LVLAQELGDRAVEAQSCYSLGNTYTLLRDYPMAVEYHLRHLIIAQQLMDRVGEGMLQLNVVIDFSSAEHLFMFHCTVKILVLTLFLTHWFRDIFDKKLSTSHSLALISTLLHLFPPPPLFPHHSEFLFYSSSISFCLPNSWCTG